MKYFVDVALFFLLLSAFISIAAHDVPSLIREPTNFGSSGSNEKWKESYKVVKDETGRFLIVHFQKKSYQLIPDMETIENLGYDINLLHTISNVTLSKYRWNGETFPSMKGGGTPLQKAIRKAFAFSDTSKLLQLRYAIPGKLNPVVIRWQGRWFATWRNGMYDSPINFAWVEFHENNINFLLEDHYWGIGVDEVTTIKLFPFNNLQEDPRLLPLSDGRLLVEYTTKVSLFKEPKQAYFYIMPPANNDSTFVENIHHHNNVRYIRRRLDEESTNSSAISNIIVPSNKVTLTDTVLLDGHQYQRSQKNWVPISQNDSLYFISSINPMRILRHLETQEDQTGVLSTVYNMDSPIDLPWNYEFGSDIRGGTPAIYLRKWGVYLAFFHTVAQLQAPKEQDRTYFMGAITFCPHFPFNIHAISPYPLIAEEFYKGPVVNPKRVDYVVFPIGLQEDEDGDHVWMTFGVRDKDGMLVKIEIKELFETLEMVHHCS